MARVGRCFLCVCAAVSCLVLTGCAPREGYGVVLDEAPVARDAVWRVGEANLFFAATGPEVPDAQFLIPDRGAERVEIGLRVVAERPIAVTLSCQGRAMVRQRDAPDRALAPGQPRQVRLPVTRAVPATLVWRPESGQCRVEWGDGHSITLRQETTAMPELAAVSTATLDCRAPDPTALDPLQRVFLDDGPMHQTCPVAPGPVRFLDDSLEALNARIEALTGRRLSQSELTSGDPYMPLDFSNAPELDLIQLSYLHIRSDFSGALTARMLVHHALRGTQVRILVTNLLMQAEDRVFYDSLAARYPNIQVQYYRWDHPGIGGPEEIFNQLQRVQHTRAFLALSPEPGRSRYIFGGRNLHDGFFFLEPFDLTEWPYLHTYTEDSFQDIGFYSIYEDVEVELRGDQAVRSVAAHHIALWNRDIRTQTVGPVVTGTPRRVDGMRHYLSLPWADGQDQIRWFADAIDAAREEVLIVTPYLNPPPQIQAAMERAAARGVPVRMVVRLESTDPAGFVITALNRLYVHRYAGIFEIEEYFPRPRMMHTKMMIIDRRLAVATSTNLDHRAFLHDTENGLIFLDTPEVGDMLRIIDRYRQSTRRLTPDEPLHPLSNVLGGWPWLLTVF